MPRKKYLSINDLRRAGMFIEVGCLCGQVRLIDPRASFHHGITGVAIIYQRMQCNHCGAGMAYSRAKENAQKNAAQ